MTKLVEQQKSLATNSLVISGSIPNVSKNDILIYNAKQTEKKLKDITNSDKAQLLEINKTISQWGYALGITVVAEDLVILNKFIRENFEYLNIFDLKVVVKLVSTDSDLLETDAEHYGKLTMIYVSKVLKAYESYKSTVCFNVKEKYQKLQEPKVTKISDEERVANFKKLLQYGKSEVENNKEFTDTGEVIYNFIRYNKLVKIDKELIDKAMQFGEMKFKNQIFDSKIGDRKKMINDVTYTSTKREDMIKRYARQYVAEYWLKNYDVEELIKNLSINMLSY